MIGFFPEPYPDELLFSICARYSEMSGYQTRTAAIYDLFQSQKARLSVDLPARLRTLISFMPPGHQLTIDRLISDHTLVPLFTPFVSSRRVSIVKENMAGARGGILHGSLGVNTFAAKVKVFRYCPLCLEVDRGAYGETYWHRSHHVPGVNICAAHKIYLKDTRVPLRYSKRRTAFTTAEASLLDADLTATQEPDDRWLSLQSTLARNAAWLLQHPIFAGYQTSHRNRYVHLLYERDYCTYSGVLDRRRLANDLTSYYSEKLLRSIKCEVATDGSEDWLNRFVHRKIGIIHPVHHLILLQFLGQTLESFLSVAGRGLQREDGKGARKRPPQTIASFVDAPFGVPPWPCLNPVCDHFKQNVVTVCEIVPTQLHPRRPRGTFTCECGFGYSRVGPDKTEADRSRLHRYVSFGERWENTLREGMEKGETYAVIRQRLQVNPKTMMRQMFRLGLNTARGKTPLVYLRNSRSCITELVDRRRISRPALERSRPVRRREFLELRKAHSNLSRSQLHLAGKALYAWLYKHDRAWLEKHLPECRTGANRKNESVWLERDAELAAAVQIEAAQIRALPGRPVLITATLIAENLEITHVWSKRPNIVPLTCKALLEVAETRDQFAVRRVAWATAHFERLGLSPATWRIALKAGLSGKTAKRPVVKTALDQAVVFLRSQLDLNFSNANVA